MSNKIKFGRLHNGTVEVRVNQKFENSNRFAMSTGVKRTEKQWKQIRERLDNDKKLLRRDNRLELFRTNLAKILLEYSIAGKKPHTLDVNMALRKSVGEDVSKTNKLTLHRYYADYIERRTDWKEGTADTFGSTLSTLKKHTKDIPLDKLKAKYFTDFFTSVEAAGSTKLRYKRHISQVLNDAIANEVLTKSTKILFSSVKVKKETKLKDVLTIEQIDILKNAKLKPKHDMYRNIFLLCYYSSQRIGDFQKVVSGEVITDINLGKIIKVKQEKSQRFATIHLNLFNGAIKPYLEICKTYNIKLTTKKEIDCFTNKVNYNLRNIMKTLELELRVTTHTARRSFCTNLYFHLGWNAEELILMTGHKTVDMFYIYINATEYQRNLKLAENIKDSNASLRKVS